MCSAMPRRIAVIGSSVSPGSVSPAATGAGAGGFAGGASSFAGSLAGGAGGAGASGCAAGAGLRPAQARAPRQAAAAAAPAAARRRTRRRRGCPSSSRGRPIRCRGTWDGSTPCSDAIRATTGDTNAFPLPDDGAGAAGGAADGSGAVGAGVSAGDAASASAAASAVAGSAGAASGSGALSVAAASPSALPPIWPSFVPTSTVAPSWTRICGQRPGGRARHFGIDLVGRDLEQRLVGLDLVALLLQPARDRPLRDGHTHLRHYDVDCGLRGHAAPS